MKYRIKIITYVNGRKDYIPQLKKGLIWSYIMYDGSLDMFSHRCQSREEALIRIDMNYSGNTKKQTIQFEYINK